MPCTAPHFFWLFLAATPLFAIFVARFFLSLLRGYEFDEFLVLLHLSFLDLFIRIRVLSCFLDGVDSCLASVGAIPTRPKFSIVQQNSTEFWATEYSFNKERLLRLDGVHIFDGFVHANMTWHFNLFRSTQTNCLVLLGQLAMLVVAPAKEGTVLHSIATNFFNFTFKFGALVLIIDAESVSHEFVARIAKLQSWNSIIINDILTEVETNLSHPQLQLLWLPDFYAWSDLFLQR